MYVVQPRLQPFWSFVALQTPRGWKQPHFGWDAVRLMASWLSLESDFGGCARTVLEWQSKYGTAGGSGRKVCFLSECALRNWGVHRHPHGELCEGSQGTIIRK